MCLSGDFGVNYPIKLLPSTMPDDPLLLDDSDEPDDDQPTLEELAKIRRATPADAAAVDALILQSCSNHWCKVAEVVGTSLKEFDARYPHLPYVYMPVRIVALERSGVLEVRGDPMAMRFSEVRLSGNL
ncbi:DUF3658 domain-containing protein [Hydrogenophaga sp. PAMC20947]|uniref:DUF3658 domain-containing protein n=1 Tax=Hydrogenophaga sp. PAMC20947 TaxID=2565558 RepID=UPI00109D8769|nr:DUF3658 domain-containing protein [Hydrogenophaga sp. PAMC20947]QCB46038.1 hypothetical protein E5678_08415 [Hydrogenophaga sp. PAMC20947]